jgi:hypothetical protein
VTELRWLAGLPIIGQREIPAIDEERLSDLASANRAFQRIGRARVSRGAAALLDHHLD